MSEPTVRHLLRALRESDAVSLITVAQLAEKYAREAEGASTVAVPRELLERCLVVMDYHPVGKTSPRRELLALLKGGGQ